MGSLYQNQGYLPNRGENRTKQAVDEKFAACLFALCNYISYVYQNLDSIRWLDYKIELWDIGWWQIRFAAKDMDGAKNLYSDFADSMKMLSEKIRFQIPALGFTPPQIEPLSDTV